MRHIIRLIGIVALLLPGLTGTAAAEPKSLDLTILATSDVHGHALDWDYFAGVPGDIPEDVAGLSLLGTVVREVRDREGPESVIVVDNGDAIQGTPFADMYGVGAPEVADLPAHPMAIAFNTLGYDALVTGNHEFDFGLDLLERYRDQLDGALLSSNVVSTTTGNPVLDPYVIINRVIDGEDVRIGVLGLATPAMNTYQVSEMPDLEIQQVVSAARHWVPIVKAQSDVVVVLAHSGSGTVPDAQLDAAAPVEDAVSNLARLVPGIDVIVQGHTHRDDPERIYTNVDGGQVLVTQPYYWARSLSEVSLSLVPDGDGWRVDWAGANTPRVTAHYAHDVSEPDAALVAAVMPAHEAALAFVARIYEPVAPSTQLMRNRTSRFEDTAILDYVNQVQTDYLRTHLAGSEWEDLPVLAATSPFTRTGVFPQGMVSTAHILGIYPYYNTLDAVVITGAQLRDYLEVSAKYFVQVEPGAAFDPETGTNANGIGDFGYDVISGVNYFIDISQDEGQRITGLAHPDGTPVGDDDEFVLAVNDFRHTGAGGYPHVADALTIHEGDMDVRDLLAAWGRERGVIDPDDFFVQNWALITEPLTVVDPTPTPEPTQTTPAPGQSQGPSQPPGPDRPKPPSTGGVQQGQNFLPAGSVAVAGLAAVVLVVGLGRRRGGLRQ